MVTSTFLFRVVVVAVADVDSGVAVIDVAGVHGVICVVTAVFVVDADVCLSGGYGI